MRRTLLLAAVLLALGAAPGAARRSSGRPTARCSPASPARTRSTKFSAEVGKRPAVFGFFTYWNAPNEYTFRNAEQAGARLMLHISTAQNYGVPEVISPRGIARGQGDAYLLSLNRRIDEAGEPVYVRLMAEMNQTNNAYCAFNANGSSRGAVAQHERVQGRVAALGADPARRPGRDDQRQAQAAQAAGRARRRRRRGTAAPAALDAVGAADRGHAEHPPPTCRPPTGPGPQYVDWVGTDFYSRFPAFAKLERFYAQYPSKPFVFGEWAMWGADTRASSSSSSRSSTRTSA